MEKAGGEPDVEGYNEKTSEYIFYNCSAEGPDDRRSFCYNREALESRKEHKPENSAIGMAAAMSIGRLTEKTIPRAAEAWRFRSENLEPGENTCRYSKTRRRALL